MLRWLFSFTVALAILTALLAFGCKGDDGGGAVLLSGDPDSPAIDAVKDFDSGDRLSMAEITEADNGARAVRTKVEIEFPVDATVGEVNALLESFEALITSMLEDVNLIIVRIPDPESLDGLDAMVAQLEASPTVESVRTLFMSEPLQLPDNYTVGTANIDHHIAVRAPAAWNAKAALEKSFAEPPLLIVLDQFGDGPPNGDFDLNSVPTEFAAGSPDPHGYHILGIIAGKHGGGPSGRGLVTGMYPGTLDLYAVDVLTGIDDATVENLIAIRARIANRPVVVNASLGETADCPIPVDCLEDYARSWMKKVRRSAYETGTTGPASLENKFLFLAAAGNIGQGYPSPDAVYSGRFQMAGLFWNLSTKEGVSLDNLNNTLVIEDRQSSTTQPYTATCLSPGSKHGGDLSAVGTFVFSFTGSSAGTDSYSGTSMASPQVAGLAAYVWALAPELSSQNVGSLLTRTARDRPCTGGAQAQPVIDAYSAVLAVDDAAALNGGGPDKAPVRMAILDVVGGSKDSLGGNGKFDEHDIERFLDELANGPGQPNYSRFDLNGDGYTGGKTNDRFNLDMDAAQTHGEVTQEIAGKNVTFNEGSVTDLKVLCYYAYSPLRTGDDAKRDQLMKPHLPKCSGSSLAFMRTPMDTASTDVYTMSDTGTDQKAVTDWKGQFSDSWGLSWAPGDRLLMSLPVFSVDYEYYDIFVMNPDGTGLTKVTNSGGIEEVEPAWHPNGQELAFTDFNSIHTIFVNGFGRAELDTSSNYTAYTPEHPAYSPSGTKLAFSDWKDNRTHVFVHTFATGQTIDLGLGSNPAWSPEGSLIAFADGDGLEELWVMSSLDGSGRTRLHRLSEDYSYMITDIAWSPDGNQIAFDAVWYSPPEPYSDDYDIYVIGVDGTGFKNITKSLGIYEQFPAWAP